MTQFEGRIVPYLQGELTFVLQTHLFVVRKQVGEPSLFLTR